MKARLVFQNWIYGWVDIICGVISVMTLGFYRPWWDMSLRCHFTRKNLLKVRADREMRRSILKDRVDRARVKK